MNAKTEAAGHGIGLVDTALLRPARRAPFGVLGFAALALWVLAVLLGIGVPLLGLDVDSRVVVGVLIASGVVSLLSLPFSAWTPGSESKPADRRERHD